MKTAAKGFGKSIMDPLHREGWWSKRIVLMVYVALELITVYSPMALGTLELQLDEEQPAGTIVGDISAGLPPGITASLYFISDHEGTGVGSDLDIDESTGIIKTAKVLDRELRDRYNFIAVTMTGVTVEVTIKVNDINDHAPKFPRKRATFKIPEQTAIGTRFPLEPAVDSDKGQLTTQGYIIKDGNVGQAFTLETRRGSSEVLYLDLVVNAILDREKRSIYTLSLEAFDGGSPKRTDQMTLDITVQDINDNAPVFNQSRYHAIISENLQPGSNILQVFATDADEGDNGMVLYEINRRQSDPDRYFVIDSRTGIITLNKPLDFEMRRVHELVVQAQDNATQPEVTNAFVTMHVRDYNDNQPTMTIIFLSEDGSPRISEGAQPGQYVARISVTDPDYGEYANVNVSLEGGDGKFALTTKDSIIYLICVDQILDREERDTYELRVMATDSGTPPLRAESSFIIQVTDVNDNPPLFDQPVYKQIIPEVVFPGSFVLQVTARDKDQGPNGDICYSILQDQSAYYSWFSIDSITGIITTLSQLDYEKNPSPSITVVATDGGKPPLSSTAVVNILLQDINDNEPVFEKNFYNVSIKENTAPGTCILEVTATDADGGSFGSITYSLGSGINSAVPSQFTIGKETGQICTSAALDRDQGPASFDFTVTAVDGGGLSSVAYVKVDLADINDNRPAFYPLSYAVSLSTQSAPGTSVVRVTAYDPDSGENGRITYKTVPGGASPYFTLNKDTGWCPANSVIPMVISAQDGGGLVALVNARVNISVVAGLVAPPVFEQTQYYFTVSEDVLRGTVVGTVQASIPPMEYISYTISSGDPAGYFTVDPDTGALRTSLPLDHEAQSALDLEVQARSGNPPAFGQTRVHITIADINDNPPVFLPSSSESLLLPEHTEMGTVIYRIQAEDRDSGVNGQLSFDLSSPSASQRIFSIERSSGEVRLVGSLSYENTPRYDLQVIAKDSGVPQLSATFMLVVHVQAENDQGPVFDTLTYRVELKEGTPIGTCFLQVRALNRETPGSGHFSPLAYYLRPDGDAAGFGIAAESGWLFVKSALDREVKDMYLLTVLASAGHGQLKKTGSATVRISVTDENDNSPRLAQERVFLAVRENLPPGTGFGHVLASDRDSGSNGRLSYRFLHPDRHFQINTHTGEISTRMTLDREQQSGYQLVVVVQDGGSPTRSATGTAFITVLDDNDNDPVFSHSQSGKNIIIQVTEGQSSGAVLGTLQAKDPDEGENGTVIYSLSGPRAERFSLNTNTGELRSSSPLSHSERAEYSLMVTATDRGLPPRSTSCSLTIQVRLLLALQNPVSNLAENLINEASSSLAKPGSVIGSVRLHNRGTLEDGEVTYTVVGGADRDGTFVVDRLTGDVYLARALDYERDARYSLQIEVDDFSQAPPSSTLVHLDIDIEDSNDHTPEFPEDPITVVISESMEPGSSVYTFQATDKDGSGPNSELVYSVLHQWPNTPGLLALEPSTGILSLGQKLDYEVTKNLILVVKATDSALEASQRRWSSVTARVYVTDENDNPPVFISPTAVSVMEDQPVGFVALYVMARDADQGENGRVSYRIQSGNSAGTFSLNPNTGSLSILKPLDREEQDIFNLTIIAEDHGIPQHSSSQLLCVHVIDVNDEVPWFEESQYEAQISENQPPGTSVLTVSASDLDQGTNGQVTYGGVSHEGFNINPVTGVITTTKALDRELQDYYTVTVYAKDGGLPPNYAKATVRIKVLDVNDNAPVFGRLYYSIEVPENLEALPLFTLRATDPDAENSGVINYRITAEDQSGDFHLDRQSGVLSTSRPLDREKRGGYTLTVIAHDQGQPSLSSTATVEVTVLDINDHSPQFQSSSYTADISEDVPIGSLVLEVKAIDLDFGPNSQVLYFLSRGSQSMFIIDQNTGRIITAAPLDRERTASYTFEVCATDSSPANPRNSTAQVTIYIQDVNDNAPFFIQDPLIVNISASSISNRRVLATMRAEDKDFGANGSVFYRFANPARGFTINSLTGDIQATEKLQTLTQSQRTLIVQAMDQGNPAQSSLGVVVIYIREQSYRGIRFSRTARDVSLLVVTATDRGTPRLAGSATLTVIIIDLNDNSPMIPLPRKIRLTQHDTLIGTVITQVTGNDVDSGPALSYTLHLDVNSQGMFGIHRYGGGVSLTGPLDYEERTWYTLTVRSSDSKHESEANLTVLVDDVNDNAPIFTHDLYQVRTPLPGSAVITVTATDRDSGENGRITYRVMSSTKGVFYIDPSNGTLFIQQQTEFDFENPSILVVIEARDQGTPSLSSIATVQVQVSDVNDNAPVFHQSEYRATVSEDGLPGSTVLTLEAVDGDLFRDNCGFDFAIASGNSGNAFQIESSVRFFEGRGFQTVGSLILVENLDFEAVPSYNLTVVVSDRGIPQRSSSVPILISVTDANDNPPAFSRTEYSVVLSEGTAAGTEILHLSATDSDSAPNGEVQYSISSGDETNLFQVDQWTGALRLQRPLDSKTQLSHMIVVQATDGQGHYALAPVSIEVKDINDNRPFFPLKLVTASIRENQPQNALVTMLHAIDHDRGVFGQLRYYMLDTSKEGKEGFLINQTSGEIRTRSTFDFEKVNSFHFEAVAMDAGNYSASVTVQVYVTGEDEYDPVFTSSEFSFEVPEGAKKGHIIGKVQARDEDGGVDGIILYSLPDHSPYFEVNNSTGAISLKMDSYSRHVSRSKREVRLVTLDVTAHSPLETSRIAVAKVTIDVTHTSFGLTTDMNMLLISVIAVSLGTIVILIIIAVALFFVKLRRHKKQQKAQERTPMSGTLLHKFEETKIAANEMIYHQALPGYTADQSGSSGGPYTRGGSLDPSHSSGRGSAEAEAAEDDEIRMINEYPRVSSISSSMQERISARGPDSGIQQDADQLSDVSCEPSIDWFKGKKLGSLNGTLLAGQVPVYRDEGGGYVGVGRGLSISRPKDYTFPEDGKPPVDGSLTAIVASEEELRGSYNWDYLLNWCPQFQPLANVFTEIARLKDETAAPHPRRSFHQKAKAESRIDPPPLITSVAHPGAKTVPPKPAVGRTFPHLASLRRSPISAEGSISSVAMSPSFSPSLSPLAARSPAITPFSVSQGPSASMISTTEHNLEHSEEAELRI
uniref:Protocadherin-16 n=1 Tax=Amphiprion percula TaxID=161767 RepID=A0A3P8SRX2_AMPPE